MSKGERVSERLREKRVRERVAESDKEESKDHAPRMTKDEVVGEILDLDSHY